MTTEEASGLTRLVLANKELNIALNKSIDMIKQHYQELSIKSFE